MPVGARSGEFDAPVRTAKVDAASTNTGLLKRVFSWSTAKVPAANDDGSRAYKEAEKRIAAAEGRDMVDDDFSEE